MDEGIIRYVSKKRLWQTDAGQITKMMSLDDMFFWWCYWITFNWWCHWMQHFFHFGDVIGVEQVWWLSINLQSNKVIVFGQISLFWSLKYFCTYYMVWAIMFHWALFGETKKWLRNSISKLGRAYIDFHSNDIILTSQVTQYPKIWAK